MNGDSFRLKQSRRKRSLSSEPYPEAPRWGEALFRYAPEALAPAIPTCFSDYAVAPSYSAPLVYFCSALDSKQPTLIVCGNHEIIVYTINSLHLVQNIPDAKIIVYPDANHGVYDQYHEQFVFETNRFLNS